MSFTSPTGQLQDLLLKTLTRANVKSTRIPACPSISLFLIDPDSLLGPLSHDEAQAVVAEPAYWSFCWASGQVLAQYLLDHPELVRGKVVVDVGCGSGIVAVAAALAGARKVYACDIDHDALLACMLNAAANHVSVDGITSLDDIAAESGDPIDLICAADLLYDRDNHALLATFRQRAPAVLLADSRMKQLPDPAYVKIATIEARTCPDLNEFEEFNQVRIYKACDER